MTTLTRYVDDTYAFIRRDEIKKVEEMLNAFDLKIQFHSYMCKLKE